MQLSVEVDNNGEPVVQLTTIVQLTRSTPRTFHNIRRHLRASHRIGSRLGTQPYKKAHNALSDKGEVSISLFKVPVHQHDQKIYHAEIPERFLKG